MGLSSGMRKLCGPDELTTTEQWMSIFEQKIHRRVSGGLSGADQVQADLLTRFSSNQRIAFNRLRR